MNIIQEDNWVTTTKKGKGKLPLFCLNVERGIPIYAYQYTVEFFLHFGSLDHCLGYGKTN